MIKINKKDSIIDIIIKIDNCKEKEIVLDFPFGHPILHNYISLKILKNKAKNKNFIIITNDKTAKKIGSKLGIKYSQIGDSDLLEYNYTSSQYAKYLIKRYFLEFINIFKDKSNNITFEYHKKHLIKNGKIGYFIIGLIISIFLFLFIFYFAVNKTYIYIKPEINIKTRAENFIFEESLNDEILNKNIVKLNKISKLIYLTNTFGTSGVNEKSISRSKGIVTFYNKLNESVDLLQNTRLITENGILYKTQSSVHIPKAKYSSTGAIIPGQVDIKIKSSIKDNTGNIAGIKSNIGSGVILTLPGLKTNKQDIYAITKTEIKGANKNYQKQLTKEDLINAEKILKAKLKQKALDELKKQIIENNKKNNIVEELLGIDGILKYSDFKILGKEKLKLGDKIENFELGGTIKITGYSYNTKKILNHLSNTIQSNLLKNIETFLFINAESLRISNIIYKTDNPLRIKATAEIEAFFSHNFLIKESNYIQKLKNKILGIKKEDAIKILLNNPNISDVQIEIRPFFINTISKIPDNIIIKVIDK